MKSRSAASDAAIRTTPTYPRSTNRFPSGEQKECIMARQSVLDPKFARIPGTGTLAKARWERDQRVTDARSDRRKPQADKARGYKFFSKGRRPLVLNELGDDSVEKRVFVAVLEEFLTAQPVRKDGKTVQGTIVVATEAAAEKLPDLFSGDSLDAALRGIEWSEKALRWAGNQLFNKKPEPAEPVSA